MMDPVQTVSQHNRNQAVVRKLFLDAEKVLSILTFNLNFTSPPDSTTVTQASR